MHAKVVWVLTSASSAQASAFSAVNGFAGKLTAEVAEEGLKVAQRKCKIGSLLHR
jgi:hypothetical protein